MDWGLLLILLLCPLMMIFMMRGHHSGGHQHDQKQNNGNHNHEHIVSNQEERMDSYKVKQLEGEIYLLKEQNETLRQEINSIKKYTSHN
ncbi:DUF2933 domain-containing protein [Bacillaceae bacterium S4-13-58]